MTGVCDEPALGGLACLQAVEHLVHGGGQPGDLVVGLWYRDTLGQVARFDALHAGPDPLDRPEGLAGQHPARGTNDEQEHGKADSQVLRHGRDGVALGSIDDATTTVYVCPPYSTPRATMR